MSTFLGSNPIWAIVVIVAIPLAVVAAAELDERVRQQESPFTRVTQILRTYALPAFALWAILAALIGLPAESLVVRLAGSAVLLAVGAAIISFLRILVNWILERRRARAQQAPPQLLLALPRLVTILVIGWVLVNRVWAVDLSGLLTALGVTSLVVSFALQGTLSGLASGLLLLSDQPFRPGDWIRAGDHEGLVIDVNWRTSRIRDRNGDTIVVPNSELAESSIRNFSSPEPLHRVVVPVQVAYVNPPTVAKEMLLDAARGTAGVLTNPPPAVAVVQTDDPLMGYEVHMWIDDYAIAPRVKSDFGALVWYQSHRHDVPLPSPAQDLFIYDGTAAGADDGPSTSAIRQWLQNTPLLASLSDEDLDRLARAGRPARYAIGENLIDSGQANRGLLVIAEGRAELVLTAADGSETLISELTAPQTAGLIESPPGGGTVSLRALTDCETVEIDAAVAGEIGSRNVGLSAALNRIAEVRRRRVNRWAEEALS